LSNRAPYNTTADLYHVNDGVRPLTPYAVSVPCRFVQQDIIIPREQYLSERVAWMTSDANLRGPVVSALPQYAYFHWGYADQVEFTDFPGLYFVVLLVERVDDAVSPYWRYWLAPVWW